MLYGLDTHEWETVLAAIAQRQEVTEVKLIGSRAMNTYRPNSDVDLVLYGEGVNLKTLGAISGELDESTLPYKFDLIAFNKVKEAAFLEHIQRYGKRIYPGVRMDRKETEVGLIPEHWKVMSIDEIKDSRKHAISMGPFGSDITVDNQVPDGVPVIKGVNLSDFYFHDDDFVYLTEEKAEQLKAAKCVARDIVITHRGTLGQVGFIPERSKYPAYIVSQSGMKLSVDEDIVDSEFVFLFLKSRVGQHLLLRNRSQTGVPALGQPTTSLREIPVPIPGLQEGRDIARIIGVISDRITNLRQQNRSLERLAQLLFKRWFVDFEFPNAQGLPYKSSGGAMQPSELGEIPEGWEVKPLKEVMRVTKGLSYKGEGLTTEGNGVPMHNLKSIQEGGGYRHDGVKWYAGDYKERHLCDAGDIIVTNTEQGERHKLIGFPARVPAYFKGATIYTHHIYRLVLKDERRCSKEFIYYQLMGHAMRRQVISYTNGTTVNMLYKEGLEEPELAVPCERVMKSFTDTIRPDWHLQEVHLKELMDLERLRDTLLPRLMNGEVRVNTVVQV